MYFWIYSYGGLLFPRFNMLFVLLDALVSHQINDLKIFTNDSYRRTKILNENQNKYDFPTCQSKITCFIDS